MHIAFYNLGHVNYDELQRYACRVLEKAYRQQEKIFVLCENERDANYLDDFLWTYNDIAFIPHQLVNQPELVAPIKIGWESSQAQTETILVNMRESIPENHQQFSRIIEFVINEEPWRNQSQKKYKSYKSNGYEPVVHNITVMTAKAGNQAA
jgi:DNA polymerase-3 subunit chi